MGYGMGKVLGSGSERSSSSSANRFFFVRVTAFDPIELRAERGREVTLFFLSAETCRGNGTETGVSLGSPNPNPKKGCSGKLVLGWLRELRSVWRRGHVACGVLVAALYLSVCVWKRRNGGSRWWEGTNWESGLPVSRVRLRCRCSSRRTGVHRCVRRARRVPGSGRGFGFK